MSRLFWRSLLTMVALKAVNQYTTYEYEIYNSNMYHTVNRTCKLKDPTDLANVTNNPTMNVIHFGYALSVVGCLMANRIGFQPVIIGGGALMSLAAALLAGSISLGLICNAAFYAFVWVLHPLYMGLVLPCLFYGFVRLSWGSKSRMVLVTLYYYSAEVSTWLEVFISPILRSNFHSYGYVSALGVCFSLVFLSLSTTLKKYQAQNFVEFPTLRRLTRCFRILTAFTLFAIQLYDNHIDEYQTEVLLYSRNSTTNTPMESGALAAMERSNVPRFVNMAAMLGASVLLVLFGVSRRTPFVSHELRIQTGISTAAAVALFCFVADLLFAKLGPASPILTSAIFCTASFLDGISEILTMVAVYEFIDMMATRDHKLLLVGVAFSIWSLAYFARYLVRYFTLDIVLPAITSDLSYRHCATHALNFFLLVTCLTYTRLVSFPLAFPLIQVDQEYPEDEAADEETPLTLPT